MQESLLPEHLNHADDKGEWVGQYKPVLQVLLPLSLESMIRSQSDHANTSLVQELTENTVTGGASMINHELAKLWQTTNDATNIFQTTS